MGVTKSCHTNKNYATKFDFSRVTKSTDITCSDVILKFPYTF